MVFGLFKKKLKHVDEPDEVYMARARADAMLVKAAAESPRPVVVASFFAESLSRIEEKLNATGATCQHIGASSADGPPADDGTIWLLDASEVATNYGFDGWMRRADREFSFLFVEHYPLRDVEQAVIDILEEISATRVQHLRFYAGLDEPLLEAFAGDRLRTLMERMGMSEDEAISHPWVDKSIVKAQQKLQKRIPNAVPAESSERWFAVNLPSGG